MNFILNILKLDNFYVLVFHPKIAFYNSLSKKILIKFCILYWINPNNIKLIPFQNTLVGISF